MTKQEAVKEIVLEVRKMVKGIREIKHFSPDKFNGYEKGFRDASRKAMSIVRQIGLK